MTHYTTLEQSKKLVELGLSLDTADMFYNEEPDEYCPKGIVDTKYPMVLREGQNHYLKEYGIPCWSLGALLEVMPKYVQINSNQTGLTIDITFVHNGVVTDSHHVKNNTFLEAAYNIVVWLLKNNYIKKGE